MRKTKLISHLTQHTSTRPHTSIIILPLMHYPHGAVLVVTDRNFAPACRLRERHVGQWLFKEFFIFVFSLFSIVEYFIFSRPSSDDGGTAEVGGTIMVTCKPFCCNNLIGQ